LTCTSRTSSFNGNEGILTEVLIDDAMKSCTYVNRPNSANICAADRRYRLGILFVVWIHFRAPEGPEPHVARRPIQYQPIPILAFVRLPQEKQKGKGNLESKEVPYSAPV